MDWSAPDRRELLLGLGSTLLAASPASAQTVPDPGTAAPVLPDLLLEEDRSSRLTTPVFLNGRGPFEFVVDTGANRTTLAAEVATELGLPSGPTVSVVGVAGTAPAPTARIEAVRVGELETANVVAPLFSRSALGADGLLGIDVFRSRRVELDFAANVLRLSPAGERPSTPSGRRGGIFADLVVPARQQSGQLMIFDADVHGRSIVCFIDTGAALSIGNEAMHRIVSRRNLQPRFAPVQATIRSATGQTATGVVADVGDIRVGNLRFSDFAMVFAPLHTFVHWGLGDRPAMLFGTDVLRMFPSVVLNFGRPQVTFRNALQRRPRPGALGAWTEPLSRSDNSGLIKR